MNASANEAVSAWLMRQLREAAGDVDRGGMPDSLEQLAARIEQQSGGKYDASPTGRERSPRK